MITAIVQFPFPKNTARADARTRFEASTPTFRNVQGLIRKYYLYGEGPTGGGVYLWEDRAAADRLYTPEWRKNLADRFGVEPNIQFFDTPVVVDNKVGEVIID